MVTSAFNFLILRNTRVSAWLSGKSCENFERISSSNLRGGPIFRTGFSILSVKGFLEPHPPTPKSYKKVLLCNPFGKQTSPAGLAGQRSILDIYGQLRTLPGTEGSYIFCQTVVSQLAPAAGTAGWVCDRLNVASQSLNLGKLYTQLWPCSSRLSSLFIWAVQC